MKAQPSYWIKRDTHKSPSTEKSSPAGRDFTFERTVWGHKGLERELVAQLPLASSLISKRQWPVQSSPGLASMPTGLSGHSAWCQRSTGTGAEQEHGGAPSCSEPRTLNEPHLSRPLPTVSPTSHRPRLWWPWRVLELQATQKLSLGRPEVQDARSVADWVCRAWLLSEATLLPGAKGAFAAMKEALLKKKRAEPALFAQEGLHH